LQCSICRNWCLSGFESEYSRMVSELANHLTTNWYLILSSFKSSFNYFGVSRYTRRIALASHRWARRDAPYLYDIFLHPILFDIFISLIVYWIACPVTSERPKVRSRVKALLLIVYLQRSIFSIKKFVSIRNWTWNSRMVSELANHLTTNWCFSLILLTSCFKHFCVSRHGAHDAQVSATRCTVSLRHILISNSLYCFHLSNGVLDSVPGYEGRGPKFDPGSRRCY
jgi:hypothetical protein